MPFGLNNAPTIFSHVVVAVFKYFIQKFLQVYMDDWTVYGVIRDHMDNMWLMLEICQQHHISLNSKKCIFCAPFGILLGHIVCKQGLLVDPVKITLILSLPCWCNCNFGMYSLLYLTYCTLMFILGCVCNVLESCHALMFRSGSFYNVNVMSSHYG